MQKPSWFSARKLLHITTKIVPPHVDYQHKNIISKKVTSLILSVALLIEFIKAIRQLASYSKCLTPLDVWQVVLSSFVTKNRLKQSYNNQMHYKVIIRNTILISMSFSIFDKLH